MQAKSAEPDKTLRSVSSDLVLHCLLMFHKKNARLLRWVKVVEIFIYNIHVRCT